MQDFGSSSWTEWVGQRAAEVLATLATILAALPDIPHAVADSFGLMHREGHLTPPGVAAFAVALLLVLAAGGVARLRVSRRAERRGLDPAWAALLGDLATVAAVLVIAAGCVALLAQERTLTGQLAVAAIWGAARWRVSMVALGIVLRPGREDLRLLPLPDDGLAALSRRTGVALALGLSFVSLMPVLLEHGFPLLPARALALVCGLLVALLLARALRRLPRQAGDGGHVLPLGAAAVLFAGWWIWTRSVIRLDFALWDAFTGALQMAAAILAAGAVGRLTLREPATLDRDAAADPRRSVAEALRRSVIAVAATLCVLAAAQEWLVSVLEIVAPADWPRVSRALSLALWVILAGYLGQEALRTWSASRYGTVRLAVPGSDDETTVSTSRLATTLPILSRTVLVASIAIGALLGLANLGVDVSPLLAGAGIFGLAISFGSQALVRDIVSGFFFVAEDAFRVGEYIDAGRHKGAVERLSLRSLRLRHQNGQVHTLPYGQIAAVTNFSRDWTTVKFNLRLAPGTNPDRVRKIAKAVGQELLADPEWGPEFIVPLKLQGIADIVETAVVLRFKFTALPGKASTLQREVLKRLFEALLGAGQRFATNALVLRADDDAAPAETPPPGAGDRPAPAAAAGRPGPWEKMALNRWRRVAGAPLAVRRPRS